MRMTLTYARISDRTVAEQYFKVAEAVKARYQGNDPLPVDVNTHGKLRPTRTGDCSATGTAPARPIPANVRPTPSIACTAR